MARSVIWEAEDVGIKSGEESGVWAWDEGVEEEVPATGSVALYSGSQTLG